MHFLLAVPDYEAVPEKYAKVLEVRHEPALFLQGCLLKVTVQFSTQSNFTNKRQENSPPHSSVCQTCMSIYQDTPQICL